ncbi:ribbon-helix-helix domain-containing protein [Rhizobium herbae]|uniref:Ribbon-helix-helix protein CopG domain-containing protein n=1 Tax=Rhizobium herbae TaxID=508661 RepID=A0ABS4EP85_9HYPH|nr:ribbon-helix-helix domain-containing protein [Rhizobium herbae]MBP1859754.1 hypothetical protein [Rhizobium herbae]
MTAAVRNAHPSPCPINETGGKFVNHVSAIVASRGRPPLNVIRLHVTLTPDDIKRIDAVAGTYARSKFIRDSVRQVLDQVEPGDEAKGPPYLEYDSGHEPRLTPPGRSVLFGAIRKRGFDQVISSLGFTDPVHFLHALLGHRTLPDRATSFLVTELLPK